MPALDRHRPILLRTAMASMMNALTVGEQGC
jgi:hypothetical protein